MRATTKQKPTRNPAPALRRVGPGSLSPRERALLYEHERLRPQTFRRYVGTVRPAYRWYRHCVALADLIDDLIEGRCRRAMAFLPPRHSKSETFSRLLPAYFLQRFPERWVGLASHTAELATTLSRVARDNYVLGGGRLAEAASTVRHWETTRGGGMWAAGAGGPITGKGFHLGIIDDPVKNAEEADSPLVRSRLLDWYQSTWYTRAEPDAALLLVVTRWNIDDLAGALLAAEEGAERPERWRILLMPALAEDERAQVPGTCSLLDDWRDPGEALCPERYNVEQLHAIREALGSHYWSALYQQRPVPRGGQVVKWDWLPVIDADPTRVIARVRYWDLAGTEGASDYTASVLLALTDAGETWIEDAVRGQWSPGRRDEEILRTAQDDAKYYGSHGVEIGLERDMGIGGRDRTQALVRKLAGFRVYTEAATGSKEHRFEPFAAQAEAGNVKLVRGDWNHLYAAELCDFPHGKHDHWVDATSGAYNRIAETAVRRGHRVSTLGIIGV